MTEIYAQRAADWQNYLHREQQIGRDICTESSILAEIFAQRAKIGRYICTKSRRLVEMFALGVRAED